MRVKTVNEAIKYLTPRSAEEIERNRGPLNKRIAQITEAIEKMASEYNEEMIINDEDPKYFSAGFSRYGNYYGIGVNPANTLPFEAQFENGKNPESDEEEVATIEDAIEYLQNWIEGAKYEDNGCKECGEELDLYGNCPNCDDEEENDEDEE